MVGCKSGRKGMKKLNRSECRDGAQWEGTEYGVAIVGNAVLIVRDAACLDLPTSAAIIGSWQGVGRSQRCSTEHSG